MQSRGDRDHHAEPQRTSLRALLPRVFFASFLLRPAPGADPPAHLTRSCAGTPRRARPPTRATPAWGPRFRLLTPRRRSGPRLLPGLPPGRRKGSAASRPRTLTQTPSPSPAAAAAAARARPRRRLWGGRTRQGAAGSRSRIASAPGWPAGRPPGRTPPPARAPSRRPRPPWPRPSRTRAPRSAGASRSSRRRNRNRIRNRNRNWNW